MTKIIGLLPFKNEQHYLPLYLKNVLPIVDQIIAINDNSTDAGKHILENTSDKIKVYSNKDFKEAGWAEFSIRNKLLELGREEKGTHFVVLDADETFSSNFVPIGRKIIEKLEPAQKLVLQWIPLWKSIDWYRDDHSVWSNNFKDFVVCDDGKIDYGIENKTTIGVSRTPGLWTPDNELKLNTKYGVVLHYQFSQWRNFQLKQAWYRINELLLQGEQFSNSINQKYSITLDDPNTFVRKCPDNWLKNIPRLDIVNMPVSWHLESIKQIFKNHGIEKFKNLNIWHINEIKQLVNK